MHKIIIKQLFDSVDQGTARRLDADLVDESRSISFSLVKIVLNQVLKYSR